MQRLFTRQYKNFNVFMLLFQAVNAAGSLSVDFRTEQRDLFGRGPRAIEVFTDFDQPAGHQTGFFPGFSQCNGLQRLFLVHHSCHQFQRPGRFGLPQQPHSELAHHHEPVSIRVEQ